MKKIISILLLVAMLFSMTVVTSYAGTIPYTTKVVETLAGDTMNPATDTISATAEYYKVTLTVTAPSSGTSYIYTIREDIPEYFSAYTYSGGYYTKTGATYTIENVNFEPNETKTFIYYLKRQDNFFGGKDVPIHDDVTSGVYETGVKKADFSDLNFTCLVNVSEEPDMNDVTVLYGQNLDLTSVINIPSYNGVRNEFTNVSYRIYDYVDGGSSTLLGEYAIAHGETTGTWNWYTGTGQYLLCTEDHQFKGAVYAEFYNDSTNFAQNSPNPSDVSTGYVWKPVLDSVSITASDKTVIEDSTHDTVAECTNLTGVEFHWEYTDKNGNVHTAPANSDDTALVTYGTAEVGSSGGYYVTPGVDYHIYSADADFDVANVVCSIAANGATATDFVLAHSDSRLHITKAVASHSHDFTLNVVPGYPDPNPGSYVVVDPNGGSWTTETPVGTEVYKANSTEWYSIGNQTAAATYTEKIKFWWDEDRIPLEDPVRSGYTFTGWTYEVNADYDPSYSASPTDLNRNHRVTYTAQWTENYVAPVTHTLTYVSNGGTSYPVETYTAGTTVDLTKHPEKTGYSFGGWYSDAALTDRVETVLMNQDRIVYAKWNDTYVPEILNGGDHYAYIVGYDDGTVKPTNPVTRAEVASIFFRLLKDEVRDANIVREVSFNDIEVYRWFNTPVSTMKKLGILTGDLDGNFRPNDPITRAEFATIAARFDQSDVEITQAFSDTQDHWANDYINRAAALGWVSGYSDGTFHPDQTITRAEVCTIVNNMLERLPKDESDLLPDMITWPDNRSGAWYYLQIQEATNSHEWKRRGDKNETWTKITEPRDWTAYN